METATPAEHNSQDSGEDDERLPPRGQRIVNELRVRQVHLFLTILSKLADTSKKTILERRKSGVKGRSLRRLGIHFAHFLGSPKWEQQRIFGIDRKQIGEEETAIAKRLEADPAAEWAVGRLFDAMSMLLSIDVTDVFGLATARPQSKVSLERELAAEIHIEPEEAPKPRARLRLVAPPPSPDQLRRSQEAAELVADRHLKSKLENVDKRIAIANSVILAGGKPNARKEQRDNAKDEAKALLGLLKERRSIRRALKELATAKAAQEGAKAAEKPPKATPKPE